MCLCQLRTRPELFLHVGFAINAPARDCRIKLVGPPMDFGFYIGHLCQRLLEPCLPSRHQGQTTSDTISILIFAMLDTPIVLPTRSAVDTRKAAWSAAARLVSNGKPLLLQVIERNGIVSGNQQAVEGSDCIDKFFACLGVSKRRDHRIDGRISNAGIVECAFLVPG